MQNINKLGVGITYSSALEPILDNYSHLIDVLEIEPQTIWFNTGNTQNKYRVDTAIIDKIKGYPFHKTLHGIGFPVGGTKLPNAYKSSPLKEMITELNVAWMSEHLSFNHVTDIKESKSHFKTGFLLPPIQTEEGIQTALHSIKCIKGMLNIPFAFETGVSYIAKQEYEMDDGRFIAEIANRADCGILLDLHNIWTNQLNGRQSVNEFLNQIPLDRVIEVHLAGGFEYEGYWLDAHSGVIPEKLFELSKKIIPSLPNLKSIIFEVFPSFIEYIGFDPIINELQRIKKLWQLRDTDAKVYQSPIVSSSSFKEKELNTPTSEVWEYTLGSLAIGKSLNSKLASELSLDPGLAIYQKLIREFRGSGLINTLKLTSRLLMLNSSVDEFNSLLSKFWDETPPQLFPSSEAYLFAKFLRKLLIDYPYLKTILEYELAVIDTIISERVNLVDFSHDPFVILRSLAERRLPENPNPGNWEVEITPDNIEPSQNVIEFLRSSNDVHH